MKGTSHKIAKHFWITIHLVKWQFIKEVETSGAVACLLTRDEYNMIACGTLIGSI